MEFGRQVQFRNARQFASVTGLAERKQLEDDHTLRTSAKRTILGFHGRDSRATRVRASRAIRYSEISSGAISSAGERFVHTEEVTGSIPVSPTRFRRSETGSQDRGVGLLIV